MTLPTTQKPIASLNIEAMVYRKLERCIQGNESFVQQQYIWEEIGERLLGVPVPTWQDNGKNSIVPSLKRHVSRALHCWVEPDSGFPVSKSDTRNPKHVKELLRLLAWAERFCDDIEEVMANMPSTAPVTAGAPVAQGSAASSLTLSPALARTADELRQQVGAMRKL